MLHTCTHVVPSYLTNTLLYDKAPRPSHKVGALYGSDTTVRIHWTNCTFVDQLYFALISIIISMHV